MTQSTLRSLMRWSHAHKVEDNISPVARMYYAASTTICCAHANSDGGRLVLGAQAGEARLAEVFREARL